MRDTAEVRSAGTHFDVQLVVLLHEEVGKKYPQRGKPGSNRESDRIEEIERRDAWSTCLALHPRSLCVALPCTFPNLLDKATCDADASQRSSSNGYTQFKDLRMSSQLGVGNFGTVRMATNKSTKARFAVKIMVKKALSESDVETLGMEVHIMRLLDHPNIVRLYDFHQVEKARV